MTVWLLPTAGVAGAEVAGAAALLGADERGRAAAFRRAEDGRDFILAHALLRRALSACDPGTAPAAWRFAIRPGGKPRLAGAGPAFNLAHARGLVAAAVGAAEPVGVDVESPGGDLAPGLAAEVLTAAEQEDLAACPAGLPRADRFLRYWTLKEALLKATGEGLRRHPAGFGMLLDPPRLAPGGVWPPDPAAWAFAEHALAAGRAAAAVPAGTALRWREGWPG
ncbi:MAG: 4'-phosphopantetheinyl transferase superfamily protein [Rhodobacteraceae bacterium]|nr:4'-phosphopantetheinyl transferase superfamily protein [Paracoccaceae bacterium]